MPKLYDFMNPEPEIGYQSETDSYEVPDFVRHTQVDQRVERRESQTPLLEVQIFSDGTSGTDASIKKVLQGDSIGARFISPQNLRNDTEQADWCFVDVEEIVKVNVWGFFAAKSGGQSEDSEPLMIHCKSRNLRRLLLGVFDGMGGAGATVVHRDGLIASEAYRASRTVRLEVILQCTKDLVNAVRFHQQPSFAIPQLSKKIFKKLNEVATRMNNPSARRMRGTLTKSFPTTFACVEVQVNNTLPVQAVIRSIWAGDSRVWVLTEKNGLQQITRDDVRIADPLEQLKQDPPLENVVSATTEFVLHEHTVILAEPCIVFCATDGVCGYVRSPGEVELLLLRGFAESRQSGRSLESILCNVFHNLANDDVSASIASFGFSDISHIVQVFQVRLEQLEHKYSNLISVGEDSERVAAIFEVWESEKTLYCARMPKVQK